MCLVQAQPDGAARGSRDGTEQCGGAQADRRGVGRVIDLEQTAGFVSRDERRQHFVDRHAAGLHGGGQHGNHDGAQVGGAAGVFLRPAVEQGTVGQRGAEKRRLASIPQNGRAIGPLAVNGDRRCRGHRCIGGIEAGKPDPVAVEQADFGLLQDFGRDGAGRIEPDDELRERLGHCHQVTLWVGSANQ